MLGKRTISLLLVLALILAAAPLAYAAGTPTVSLSSGEANAGETVTLTVSIENNPGIAACVLYFYFDTDVFTVDPDEDLVAVGAYARGGVVCNSIANAKENGRYSGDEAEDGVLVLWYSSSGLNTSTNGNMFKITLRTSENARGGVYPVGMGYSYNDTNNDEEENVELAVLGGSITVTADNAAPEEDGSEQFPADPEPDDPEVSDTPYFNDISGHWAESYINRGAEIKLVDGKAPGKFDPDGIMTRAEMVTVLWRALGSPEPTKPASFTDLTQDWYKDAIAWAEENKVVDGVAEGKFAPSATVTREQVVTVLHRVLGTPVGMETLFYSTYDEQFTDSGAVSSWAKEAVYWAVYKGIYCGEDATYLEDKLAAGADATRAQIVVMIVRYLDKQ